MAIKGSYDFKGITISDAYLQVSSVCYHSHSSVSKELETDAVYDEDGNILAEPVYKDVWTKHSGSNCEVMVFKDQETRDLDPNGQIMSFSFNFDGSLTASAKNHVKQAYQALKAEEKYKDYTDV
jgi:hypothetical protein